MPPKTFIVLIVTVIAAAALSVFTANLMFADTQSALPVMGVIAVCVAGLLRIVTMRRGQDHDK